MQVAPQKVFASLIYNPSAGKVINNGTIRIPMKELGTCISVNNCMWEKKELTFYPDSELSIPGAPLSPGKTYKIKYFNWIKDKTEEIELPAL